MAEYSLNNRGLTPPQPMIRTLEKLDEMQKGDRLTINNDRQPMFLYPELDERGYSYETTQLPDGSYQIIITK